MEKSFVADSPTIASFETSEGDKVKYISSSCSRTAESEECVIFQQLDIFAQGFSIMEEIRRQGKLCDVTLKVRYFCFYFLIYH